MKKLLATILALVMALGLCSVSWAAGEEGQGGADSASKPVEVWNGYSGAKVSSHATITDAVANLGENKWIVINGDYTLDGNFTIPEGVFVDVAKDAKLTVAQGVTLTVAANAKRLGVRDGGTLVNNGTILVYGKVMVQDGGTFDINTLCVPEGYILGSNGDSYFATVAAFEVTYSNGTKKLAGQDLGDLSGAKKLTMLSNVENFARSFGSTDELAEDFVLDLGGFTLSGKSTASTKVLTISVPMTIQHGTIKYMSSNARYGAMTTSADVVIASNVTIDGGVGYGIETDGYSGAVLTVNGTVRTNGGYAITGNGREETGGDIRDCDIVVNDDAKIEAPNGVGIYHPEKGTVTVNGGTISGNTGIQMCAGELVVKGGSITASGTPEQGGNDGPVFDGAAVSILNRSYPGGTPTMEISGGAVRANGTNVPAVKAYTYNEGAVSDWEGVKEFVKVSGGTFSSDPSAYVGAQPVATAGSDYIVGSAAIADAANSGKEVTITKGGAIDGVDSGKSIKVGEGVEGVTINNVAVGAGKTYTVPVRYYYYNPSSTDTKKDEGKTSPKTFDAGVGIYAVTAVLSVTGMAWTAKKRH